MKKALYAILPTPPAVNVFPTQNAAAVCIVILIAIVKRAAFKRLEPVCLAVNKAGIASLATCAKEELVCRARLEAIVKHALQAQHRILPIANMGKYVPAAGLVLPPNTPVNCVGRARTLAVLKI